MTTLSPIRGPGSGPRAGGLGHRLRRALVPSTMLAILLCAAAAFSGWALLERPQSPPDFDGEIAGLAFSPFQRGESPEAGHWPNREEIRSDLQRAADLTSRIRTYTVQGVFGDIPAMAGSLPLHITLGAWLDGHGETDSAELRRLIEVTRLNSNVDRVLVGNEAVLRRDLTPAQLAADLLLVKRAVHVPVSTAEPWHVWLAHPELAAASDYITLHLLPYWEGVPVDDALRFTLEKLDAVHAAYPDKPIVIGEVGWPSNGVDIGGARASRVDQAAFLRGFFVAARARHLDYFVMEAFDQPWKTSFEGRAAGYWGLLDLDRHAKWPMTGPVWETPRWPAWAAVSSLAAALLAWALLSRRPDIRLTGKVMLALLTQGCAAALAGVLLAMSGRYLSAGAGLVWGALAAGQALLILLLIADGFELAETVFTGARRRLPAIVPAAPGADLPFVSLHLPICNEPAHMVCRTLDALAALDYPDFEVLVVDNNTTDPAMWEPVAEHCARLGGRFRFFHLGRHTGFKAGALNFALRHTAKRAEVIGVLDSDYTVDPDWLRCMAPQFDDPRVGFVQSPQDYRDAQASLFKRLMFWEYAGFFHLGMVTRNERNAIIQHGTMTLIRRQALEGVADAGGRSWAEWCICEDAELGLKLLRDGWHSVYSSRSFGRGVMPDDFAAFRKQRFRWAFGAMQICRHHWRALLSPFNRDLTVGQRWHFLTGWLPWVGDALGLLFLLMGLGWSAGLILAPARFEFPVVLFMLPSLGMFTFKAVQIFMLYRSRVPCGWRDRLGAAAAGLALSHTIGRAVWKSLLGRPAAFRRTPKMAAAPAVLQGLLMAAEELALLLLSWAALAGVAYTHRFATWEATLWCCVLLVQSLPCLAAVAVSVVAAMPGPTAGYRAARVRPAKLAAFAPILLRQPDLQPPGPSGAAASIVARSGAGD